MVSAIHEFQFQHAGLLKTISYHAGKTQQDKFTALKMCLNENVFQRKVV